MIGLNTNFGLTSTGAFSLSSGKDKAINRLTMLVYFTKLRVYTPDYNPGFETLIQKPSSYLFQFRQVILGRLLKLITKYVAEINVTGMDIVYNHRNRLQYGIYTEYKYADSSTPSSSVIFLG